MLIDCSHVIANFEMTLSAACRHAAKILTRCLLINMIGIIYSGMEITGVIKMSARELSIDDKEDEDTKQSNRENRRLVIRGIDILIENELRFLEQLIYDTCNNEFSEKEEEYSDDADFYNQMDSIELHLTTVDRLAKVRAYLAARHEGITGHVV
jgi:hypothetical protein